MGVSIIYRKCLVSEGQKELYPWDPKATAMFRAQALVNTKTCTL